MNNFKVGDKVRFTDEFGKTRTGKITRIVPRGEYSAAGISVSIKADDSPNTGFYVRAMSDISAA